MELPGNDIQTETVQALYITFCQQYGIDMPAAKNKMGQVIAKILNQPHLKQKTINGKIDYFYADTGYQSEAIRRQLNPAITLPDHFSMQLYKPYLIFIISTGMYFDTTLIDYHVLVNINDMTMSMSVRGIEIEVEKFGMAKHVRHFDQPFFTGLAKITDAFKLCSG